MDSAAEYPRLSANPHAPDELRVDCGPNDRITLAPGDIVSVAQYDNRLYRYTDWDAFDDRILFHAVGMGSPVPMFTVTTDQFATDVATGDITPVTCSRADWLRDTVRCLCARDWIDLSPPEKGDVPEWMK